MIKYLISGNIKANELLDKYIFSIVPLYNPDGVELGYSNHNANNIDIEGGWDLTEPEPEVKALRKLYKSYMDSPLPIRAALNMHSSVACERYFVYHHSNGTSLKYSELEKQFIAGVQEFFPGGFQNWDYYVSWTTGTPTVYPESWFWFNYNDSVIALTYEDMNCTSAGKYDSTAIALLGGIKDYLDANQTSIRYYQNNNSNNDQSFDIFPNPVRSSSLMNIKIKNPPIRIDHIELFNLSGLKILTLNYQSKANLIQIALPKLNPGVYYLTLMGSGYSRHEKFIVE
jgi:hypothetical protein